MNDLYKYHIYSPALTFGDSPTFVDVTKSEQKGFRSLYGVTQETAEAIKQTGTTQGFKGIVWSERIWLDFDSYPAGERAGSSLEELGYDFIVYDTGNRGMHFGILRLGGPSHLLPARDKAWATAAFPEADKSIYTHLHLFRTPGAIHHKTGKHKTLIYEAKGKPLEVPPWRPNVLLPATNMAHSSDTSVFDLHRVMMNSVPAHNGQRHHQLVRLAYALRDDAQVGSYEARWWMGEVNKMFEEPKREEDLDQLIRSIYG